jgi:AcrR family transcriptional regulator
MTQAPRRKQVDRRRETRSLLIGAAAELLRTVGYAGTTTALIAKQAGLTTGALHHHFATKEDLMLSVLDRSSERVLARMEQQDHRTEDGGIDVKSLIAHLWEVYGDPDYWAIWEIIIGTRTDAAFHRRVMEHRLESIRSVLQPWVRQHMLAGRPESEMLALFEFMLVAIRGLSLERFLDKDEAYFARNLDLLAELVGRKLAALPPQRAARTN